jgi:hypothetical protein
MYTIVKLLLYNDMIYNLYINYKCKSYGTTRKLYSG